MKLLIEPKFRGVDAKGDGGIRRVAEAQARHLPKYGIEIVESEEDADVVAVHAGMQVRTLKPIIAHCHGLYWREFEWSSWSEHVNREVAQNIVHAAAVTVPSQWVADTVKHAFWREPIVVGHGIDPEEFEVGDNEGYVLWNKTRVDRVCTLDGLEYLAKHAKTVQFVSTFGSPIYTNIRTVGRQSYDDAKRTVRGAAVYLATAKETFGIGVLEAMAYGVPILGWDWGGVSEIVEHKRHGYLAKPGDYSDLLNGLFFCLQNRDELSAEVCTYAVTEFCWEKQILPYVDLYRDVARQSRSDRISVVITCHNLGSYLQRAVASCNGADEIVIVDDASTDDSVEIAQTIAADDPRVTLLTQTTNTHVAIARNNGIKRTTGDYIAVLDADDQFGPDALPLLRDVLKRSPYTDIVFGAMQCVDESGKVLEKFGPNGISSWPTDYKYRGLQTYPMSYCPINSLFRRVVWERTGGFRRRYKGVEDADFWTRAVSIGFVPRKAVESVTLIYTVREDSLSHVEKRVDWCSWYPKEPPAPALGPVRIPMKDRPVVSVIVPVGAGHEHFVVDVLDSLWGQSYAYWEAIVVSDGVELSLPVWAKHISLPSSSGPARARNMGIAAARGKYLCFVDADDYLQPSALEELVSCIERTNGYVYSDWADQNNVVYASSDCVCKDLVEKCPIPIGILYPKAAGLKFDEALDFWEDWDFLWQLETSGYHGTRIAKPLYKYRLDTGMRRRSSTVEEIRAKWKEYFVGEKTLACGACSQRTVQQISSEQNLQDGNWVLLKYQSDQYGPRTFRGPSRTLYRFGSDRLHNVKYVRAEDVDYFLSLGTFVRAESTN